MEQSGPIGDAENRVDAAEHEDDPTRLEALSQLHDILESELDRPEEDSAEVHAEEGPDSDSAS